MVTGREWDINNQLAVFVNSLSVVTVDPAAFVLSHCFVSSFQVVARHTLNRSSIRKQKEMTT